MKRLLMILLLLGTLLPQATAQEGLQVARVFAQYGHVKGCKLVEMHDTELRGYRLDTYIALTYKQQGREIEKLLEPDRQAARKIREVVSDGVVSGGYYQMQALSPERQRYILFHRTSQRSGAVVYIEGPLSPDNILKLCYSRK